MVDHEVDDDAGDGDVEPEGEGPAGNAAMLVETFEESATKGEDDEWNDGDREDGVGDEDSEIDGTDPAVALEKDYLVSAEVMDYVGHQEGAGDEEGGEHEFLVEVAFAVADGGVAGSEKDGAGAVEGGVEGGLGHRKFSVISYQFSVKHKSEWGGNVGGSGEWLVASDEKKNEEK